MYGATITPEALQICRDRETIIKPTDIADTPRQEDDNPTDIAEASKHRFKSQSG